MHRFRFFISLSVVLALAFIAFAPASGAEANLSGVNVCASALSAAEEAAAPYRAVLDAFLNGLTDQLLEEAETRGDQLIRKIAVAKKGETVTLTGDTVFRTGAMASVRKNASVILDLDGHVLLNPAFPGGTWLFRNGTVADAEFISDKQPVSLSVAENCAFLIAGETIFSEQDASPVTRQADTTDDSGPGACALLLSAAGQISVINQGLIQGVHFDSSVKCNLENTGTIASRGPALYISSVRKPGPKRFTNDGVIASGAGCVLDNAGALLSVSGQGAMYGFGSLTVKGNPCTLGCPLVADDEGLSDADKSFLKAQNSVPGVIYELRNTDDTTVSKITLAAPLWASVAPVRASLPLSEKTYLTVDGAPAAGSPSSIIPVTLILSDSKTELRKQADADLKTAMRALKTAEFCKSGGSVTVEAFRHRKDSNGRYTARLSSGDTIWTRLAGAYDGKYCAWGEPEEADSLTSQPLDGTEKLANAASVAGGKGLLVVDCDYVAEGDTAVVFPAELSVEGNGHTVGADGGALRLTVNKSVSVENAGFRGQLKIFNAEEALRGAAVFAMKDSSFTDIYINPNVHLNAANCDLADGGNLTVNDSLVTLDHLTVGKGASVTVAGSKSAAPIKNVTFGEGSVFRISTANVEADASCSFTDVELTTNAYILYRTYNINTTFTSRTPVTGRLLIRAGTQEITANTDASALEIVVDKDHINRKNKTIRFNGRADSISVTFSGGNTCKAVYLTGTTGSEPAVLHLDSAAPAGADLLAWYQPYLSLIKARKMIASDGQPVIFTPQPQPESGPVSFRQNQVGGWVIYEP